ncbi:hypothetical protein [Agromyces sp. PvR057]|uniref:hypothetical protein n=1 Tax=Agromyces sp. PvR057 TaxID=3156403 RepID=UPI003394F32F
MSEHTFTPDPERLKLALGIGEPSRVLHGWEVLAGNGQRLHPANYTHADLAAVIAAAPHDLDARRLLSEWARAHGWVLTETEPVREPGAVNGGEWLHWRGNWDRIEPDRAFWATVPAEVRVACEPRAVLVDLLMREAERTGRDPGEVLAEAADRIAARAESEPR